MSDPVPIVQVQAAVTKTLHTIEHTPEGADPHHRTFQTVRFHTTSAVASRAPSSEQNLRVAERDKKDNLILPRYLDFTRQKCRNTIRMPFLIDYLIYSSNDTSR